MFYLFTEAWTREFKANVKDKKSLLFVTQVNASWLMLKSFSLQKHCHVVRQCNHFACNTDVVFGKLVANLGCVVIVI